MVRNATLATLGLFMISCSVSSPTSVPVPVVSAVSLSAAPNPVTATPSGDPSFPNHAQWTLTITETNGVGCNVRAMFVSAAGVQFHFMSTPEAFTHIAANASIKVPVAVTYSLSGRQVTFFEDVRVTDDHGNNFDAQDTVDVHAF
jgi:hypothetical protein